MKSQVRLNRVGSFHFKGEFRRWLRVMRSFHSNRQRIGIVNEFEKGKRSILSNVKDVVLEKERYVRTSVTVYENETDSKIASFIKKGNKLDIIGYDKLFDDGNVNMYKIKKDDIYHLN